VGVGLRRWRRALNGNFWPERVISLAINRLALFMCVVTLSKTTSNPQRTWCYTDSSAADSNRIPKIVPIWFPGAVRAMPATVKIRTDYSAAELRRLAANSAMTGTGQVETIEAV
jgi:hypothetical protein